MDGYSAPLPTLFLILSVGSITENPSTATATLCLLLQHKMKHTLENNQIDSCVMVKLHMIDKIHYKSVY